MHSNSLANLRGGSKPGHKRKLAIKFVNDYTDLMTTDYPLFCERLRSLSAKDYVEAYIKLMRVVLPKQLNVKVDEPFEKPTWVIQLASEVIDTPTATVEDE